MYYVMENKNDVVVLEDVESQKNWIEQMSFKLIGTRKTAKGAQRLADKRCEL
jgi:hypothetical protein